MIHTDSLLVRFTARLLTLLAAVWMTGCSVPLQIARSTQMEFYRITLNKELVETVREKSEEEIRKRNKLTDAIFSTLVGKPNWETLGERHGEDKLHRLIKNEKALIRGWTNLVFYPEPSLNGDFVLEGSGRFFVIDRSEDDERILLSGDVMIEPQRFIEKKLREDKKMDIKARYIVNRIPGQPVYYHYGETVLRILLEHKKRSYNIRYHAPGHEVSAPAHEVVVQLEGEEESLGRIDFEHDEFSKEKSTDLRRNPLLRAHK